jgi:hypothetical protein
VIAKLSSYKNGILNNTKKIRKGNFSDEKMESAISYLNDRAVNDRSYISCSTPKDQPDSSAYVGYDWNGNLPAFKDANGVPIPFRPTLVKPPAGYQGDFYVDEFTDAKIKQAWLEWKARDPVIAKKVEMYSINSDINGYGKKCRRIGALEPKGAVNGNDDLKLADIRQPAFFGQSPYFEEIGKVEQNTYTIEFTVPRGVSEELHLKQTTPIKLRGWFIKGNGVPDDQGQKVQALVIYITGSTSSAFTIQNPDAPSCWYNEKNKKYENYTLPNILLKTEQLGVRQRRQYLYEFNQAGFDVLVVDKRAHGYSGGYNDGDNSENSEDIFRMLDQLETGQGLTVLTPAGQLLQGKQVAGLLLRGAPAKQVPVIVGGMSQGSMITCYVMQKNFIGWTAFNEPGQKFTPAKNYNIKAALLLGDFAGGLGYGVSDSMKYEAGFRVEKNTMIWPTSEIMSNIDKWPAVFFGKGLWDNWSSPEGTYEAYRRAKGLKELVFIRGGHSENAWGMQNSVYMTHRMTEFAVQAIVNPGAKYLELKSFKEAVLSSPPYWEPSSRP